MTASRFAHPRTVIRLAGLLLLATVIAPTTADVDLWGHVLFGSDILRDGAIARVDPYAFTSDRTWVNHEWLSEIFMALAFKTFGPGGLILLKLLVVAGVAAAAWASVRRADLSASSRDLIVGLSIILTLPRTQHVRPQLFSVLLCAVLLLLMIRWASGQRRALWFVPAVLGLWANFHGGWIVGLGVFGLWALAEAVLPQAAWRDRRQLALVTLASIAATLINPYGVGLWLFLWETVGIGRQDIQEWGPITTAAPGIVALWAACLLLLLWTLRRVGSPRISFTVVALTLAALSFKVGRIDAFFALAVVMLLRPRVSPATTVAAPARPVNPAFIGALCAALACVPLLAFASTKQSTVCIDMNRGWLPEREAVAFIKANQIRGRIVTFFDWGEYAIWHLAPDVKVSMDGRRETVYSPHQVTRHLDLYAGRASDDAIRSLDADYVWLPTRLPVEARFPALGWTPIHRGSNSVIFGRESSRTFSMPEPDQTPRCFPGP